jgi:hemerythrin
MLKWQEYLALGVPDIGSQHRALFEKFRHCSPLMQQGSSAEELDRLFRIGRATKRFMRQKTS